MNPVLQEGLEGNPISPLGEAARGLLAGLFNRIVQALAQRGSDRGGVRGELRTKSEGGPIARDLSQPPCKVPRWMVGVGVCRSFRKSVILG